MVHEHTHERPGYGAAFAIGLFLNLGFVIAELVYGRIAHSLALVADAGHNATDVLSLLIAWIALLLSRRHPTPSRTFGMRKSSILASLLNAVILLVAMGAIAWEAIRRFAEPAGVDGRTVMAVAAIGVIINGLTALLFASGRKGELNVRGAFLHMAADAGVSLGVIVSGALIVATSHLWIDPVVSLAIVVTLLFGSWGLLRDSVNLALDAVPEGIDTSAISEHLRSLRGVIDVHDLHIWGLSTTEAALTAHIVVASHADDTFLIQTEQDLHTRFGIEHSTLQVETQNMDTSCHCRLIRKSS